MNWTDLAGPLIKYGVPSVGRMIAGPAGEKIGEAAGEILAEALGVPPTPGAVVAGIENNPTVIAALEDPAVQLALVALERETIAARLAMADKDRAEGPLAYAWRWGWMYLLGLFWIWALVLVPAVNAATGGRIALPDLGILMTLTMAYLGLYMGGHTIKATLGKR